MKKHLPFRPIHKVFVTKERSYWWILDCIWYVILYGRNNNTCIVKKMSKTIIRTQRCREIKLFWSISFHMIFIASKWLQFSSFKHRIVNTNLKYTHSVVLPILKVNHAISQSLVAKLPWHLMFPFAWCRQKSYCNHKYITWEHKRKDFLSVLI